LRRNLELKIVFGDEIPNSFAVILFAMEVETFTSFEMGFGTVSTKIGILDRRRQRNGLFGSGTCLAVVVTEDLNSIHTQFKIVDQNDVFARLGCSLK